MVKDEQGQSMVEMALLLPVMLLLLAGIFDFGRVFYSYVHLQMASQETVRLGGLGKPDAEIISFARNYVHIGETDLLQVQVSPTQETRTPGGYVTVTLVYPVELMTPVLSKLFPSPIILSANSTIRVE
ncbi:TadE/TadG family type IV pilus assembly protein [Brevibacillus sp. SYSU BS000544]|uniref:TadE/TadG family type IV pilus assembly protein n=1 Tax=Brevibacillus sp. SYSU BS000544 TaxID=3416443 RepID=UPI003CE52788